MHHYARPKHDQCTSVSSGAARLRVCDTCATVFMCLQTKDVEVNFRQMFLNTVEGLEAGGAKLQHVQFVSGEACSFSKSVAQ